MEWSRSPSRSREPIRRDGPARPARPARRPFPGRPAPAGLPSERRFRTMVALSGGFHIVAFVAFLLMGSLPRRPLLEDVAVVDLVGGPSAPAGLPEPEPPSPPAEEPPEPRPAAEPEPPAPPPPKAAPAPKEAPPPRAAKAPAAPPERARTSPDGLLPPRPAEPERKVPDARKAEEAINRFKARAKHSQDVREIVEQRIRERAAASAVKGVRERATRRVDLSSIRPAAGGGTSGAGAGAGTGAAGNVRATAEQLLYFRALDEKIRANWIPPQGDTSSLLVQVVVTIETSGKVSGVVVEKGSGNEYFDLSVQRAIHKASPLPVPPERLREGEEGYSVGFRFRGA